MQRGPNLTLRPWDLRDGDPGEPERVLGIPVDRLLARRADAPGALVVLEDRRLALSGPLAAVGRHRFLREYVRQRSAHKRDEAYRTWLAEVSAVLDGMRPERRDRSATKGPSRSAPVTEPTGRAGSAPASAGPPGPGGVPTGTT